MGDLLADKKSAEINLNVVQLGFDYGIISVIFRGKVIGVMRCLPCGKSLDSRENLMPASKAQQIRYIQM